MKDQNELINSKLDVLLINPPFSRLKGNPYDVYFPLNIGYLASALRDICNVKIYNAEDPLGTENEELAQEDNKYKKYDDLFNSTSNYKRALESDSHPAWREAKKTFIKYQPKIIGISCMSAKFTAALKVAQIYKTLFPEGFVIVGGQHPTIRTDEVLLSKSVDFVVRGEGDETIVEIVSALLNKKVSLNDLAKIKGISFRRGNSITHTENRALISELDKLNFPARDLLIKPIKNKGAYSVIISSRGCPYDCGFCSAKAVVGRKTRYRSISNVIDEIIKVRDEYKISNLFFWDDTFTVKRKRTIELSRAMRELGILWSCTTRVNTIDYNLLKEMKKGGCFSIDYGVESGSERMLTKINKNITMTQIEQAISYSIKAGIIPNIFLMAGFPDEREEDIRETIAFANKTKAFGLVLSVFTPYPGTMLFERAILLGLIKKEFDWGNFSHQSFSNHFTQCVSSDKFHYLIKELISVVDKHNTSFYNQKIRSAIIAMNHPKYFLTKYITLLKNKIFKVG